MESGAYPYEFGLEVASLISNRGDRPDPNEFPSSDYFCNDHLGSLDDFRKGRTRAWWRRT